MLKQFGLSFLGSLLAGIFLLSTAPAWWEPWWNWITTPSPLVLFVPSADMSKSVAAMKRAACDLEAIRATTPMSTLTNRQRSEKRRLLRTYYERCLEREGFTRTVVNVDPAK